jgi:hypothetical protein
VAERLSASGPSAGSLGGAANWAGNDHERAVGAFLAAHLLAQRPVKSFELPPAASVPLTLRLQADEPVDDIVCDLSGGGCAYLQAKTRMDHTRASDRSFSSVIGQWRRLAAKRSLRPSKDRVLAVAETTSDSIRTLREVLERGRRPVSETDTAKQATEKQRFEDALSSLSDPRRQVLTSCARIWIAEFARDDSTTVALAESHLRLVVGEAKAGHAWDRLLKVMGDGARLRAGFDREALADELRKVGIDLLSDAPGSPGAIRGVVARYRQRVISRGSKLTFVGLGATIPSVEIELADADVAVAEIDASEDREHPYTSQLEWWVRRRGKVVLTGLPGSGKSTTLQRATAFYARTAGWPLPVFVRLDRLSKLLAARSFRDAVLDLATEDAGHADRETLRRSLDKAIDGGEVLLALDALDEARGMRHEVIRLLAEFLEGLSADVEVVVSTRDVAYADARSLGFRELRLMSPRDSERTVAVILERLAELRGVTEAEREAWIDERSSWVSRALGQNMALTETPLVAVLLAQLASLHQAQALPARRGLILWQVVEGVVDQWEQSKELDAQDVGSLSGPMARRALLESYPEIAATLMEDAHPTFDDARAQVAARLRACFGMRNVEAEVAAEEAVAFWDQAGFFVAHGHEEQLLARLQLFAEVGDAKRAVGLDETARQAWVANAIQRPASHESLCLACELEPSTAELVVASATADEALLAASCARAAQEIPDHCRAVLLDLLVDRIGADADERWRAAKHAVDVVRGDVGGERDLVRAAFGHLEPKQQLVARAAAVIAWDEHGPKADAALMGVFDVDRVETTREDALAFLTVDELLSRTIVAAARRLLPGNRPLAERLAGKQDMTARAIKDTLVELGFDDLVAEQLERERTEFAELSAGRDLSSQLQELHEFDLVMLRWLASSAEHSELEFAERRRLDDLIDFWTSLAIGRAPAFEPSGVYRYHAARLTQLIDLLLTLSGLRGSVLASQAQLMLTEIRDDWRPQSTSDMLHMPGKMRSFSHWEAVDDHDRALEILVPFLGVGRWLPPLARHALAFRDFEDDELGRLEAYVLELKRPWHRSFGSELVLAMANANSKLSEYLASDDAARRAAAGAVLAHQVHSGGHSDQQLTALLDDPDDQVRADFLGDLARRPVAGAVRAQILAADWTPRPWTCFECSHRNQAGGGGCHACRTVGGDVQQALKKFKEAEGA